MQAARRPSNEELAREASGFDLDGYLTACEIEVALFRDLYSVAPHAIQKDLGEDTEAKATAIKTFDPDDSWEVTGD